jgi:hypothetical protein
LVWADTRATSYTATYGVAPSCTDSFGYTCSTTTRPFLNADTVLPLTGDNAVAQVTLPFPITLYGAAYTSAWVHTNGKLSFTMQVQRADQTVLGGADRQLDQRGRVPAHRDFADTYS